MAVLALNSFSQFQTKQKPFATLAVSESKNNQTSGFNLGLFFGASINKRKLCDSVLNLWQMVLMEALSPTLNQKPVSDL